MKPKHKAGKGRIYFSIASTARRRKKYTSIKLREPIQTKKVKVYTFFSVQILTEKIYKLTQFNEAHYIQAKGRPELIFSPVYITAKHQTGWKEYFIFNL